MAIWVLRWGVSYIIRHEKFAADDEPLDLGQKTELHEFHHIPLDCLIQISLAIGFSARTARHPAAQKWELGI